LIKLQFKISVSEYRFKILNILNIKNGKGTKGSGFNFDKPVGSSDQRSKSVPPVSADRSHWTQVRRADLGTVWESSSSSKNGFGFGSFKGTTLSQEPVSFL
jgi:hypothetical protein